MVKCVYGVIIEARKTCETREYLYTCGRGLEAVVASRNSTHESRHDHVLRYGMGFAGAKAIISWRLIQLAEKPQNLVHH